MTVPLFCALSSKTITLVSFKTVPLICALPSKTITLVSFKTGPLMGALHSKTITLVPFKTVPLICVDESSRTQCQYPLVSVMIILIEKLTS